MYAPFEMKHSLCVYPYIHMHVFYRNGAKFVCLSFHIYFSLSMHLKFISLSKILEFVIHMSNVKYTYNIQCTVGRETYEGFNFHRLQNLALQVKIHGYYTFL